MSDGPLARRLGTSYQSSSRDYLGRYMQLQSHLDTDQQNSFALLTSPKSSPVSTRSPSSPTHRRRSFEHPKAERETISDELASSVPAPIFPPTTMQRQESIDQQDTEGESLSRVTSQIKATLTELLNHDDVKCNDSFRHWVQDRLLEAEFELKSQRRRSRRKSSLDRDALEAIASSIKSGS